MIPENLIVLFNLLDLSDVLNLDFSTYMHSHIFGCTWLCAPYQSR